MKIKNLAFYGVMAAILGSVGTARADDSTIIASKGYVDAYAQKQSDRVQTTWANTSSTDKSSTDKYPSMNTLNDAITTVTNNQAQSDWSVTDTTSPAYIKNKFADGTQTGTGVVKTVTQSNGTVSATAGTVDTAEITNGAVTYAKVNSAAKQEAQVLGANETVTRWDPSAASGAAGYAADDKFPTVKAVAQQIADINVSAAVQNGTNALELANATDKAPSVTAVKGITDDTTTTYTARNASTKELSGAGSSTKVPTTKALVTALKDLDMAEINNLHQTDAEYGKAVTKISQVDGKVYAEMGQIRSQGIADSSITYGKIDNSVVTGAQDGTVVPWNTTETNQSSAAYTADNKFPTVKAVAQQIAAGAVTPNTAIDPSTVNSIVTYDAKGLVTGGIKLDTTLNNINVTSGGSTCSASNPCVLSYIGNNTYRWTNMDTEGLNAATGS